MSEKTPAGQMPATDSADEIRDLVGDDSTATFESDPKFIEPTPGKAGSSENLQDRKDREEIQHEPSLKTRDTDDVKDSDEEIAEADDLSAADEEDDEDDDFEDDEDTDLDAEDDATSMPVMRAAAADDDDDSEDEDDEDDDFEDDEDDEDDAEYEDDDDEEFDDDEDDAEFEDDDDEEDEDDAVEVASRRGDSASVLHARTTADGQDTEAARTGETDPTINEDPALSDEAIEEQDTDVVADKALRMRAMLSSSVTSARSGSAAI